MDVTCKLEWDLQPNIWVATLQINGQQKEIFWNFDSVRDTFAGFICYS